MCERCGLDFDTAWAAWPSTAEPVTPTRVANRHLGRRLLGTGTAVVVGLLLLFGLTRLISTTASAGPTPNAAAGAEASAPPRTPAPTAVPTERALAPSGKTVQAKVVRIVDGDTIVVMIGGKNLRVRYIGVDTPEVVDPKVPVQFMGPEAAAANKNLVADKPVWLETDTSETDRFGRLLRYVWLADGPRWTLVNLELVRLGLARAVSYPPDTRLDPIFAAAQRDAKAAGRGLWAPTSKPSP